MTRLLIFEPSFRLIEGQLAELGVEAVVVDRQGGLGSEAEPDIGWFSGELYRQPAARALVRAALASSRMQWFHSAAAGFDDPFFARLVAKGVRLSTSHGQAVGMADYALAGVLDHFQRGPERRAAQAEGAWRSLPFREVNGSSWLIVGFGAVGQGVAARARAFGARIVGVRRDQSPHPGADAIAALADLPRLLPEADVVLLSAPLSAATRHLADAGFFAAMKEGSVLVNVGRGALVDEAALLGALEKGRPAHAVLDVFETEPLAPESPFWRHPRVSLSAHCSGVTGAQDGRNRDLFVDNLRRWLDGQPLLYEVDPHDLLAPAQAI
ncbi:MAG TPA: NAD(P)-dependent oxidoreductase [Caulobacteraceae bacterium]|nr:NAD(P)-dependent oxidoreductase [Caulobacteraceae bacterium]